MRRALLCCCVLLLAAACSDDGDESADVDAFCDRLLELEEAGEDEEVDATDLDDLDRLYDQLDELAAIAPDEIADDLELIAAGQRFLATGLGEGEELPPSIAELDGDELNAALSDAYGEVEAYLQDECGIGVTPSP